MRAIVASLVAPAALWTRWLDLPRKRREHVAKFAAYVALTTALFVQPLTGLLRLAAELPLHSHIPLVPFVVGYLLYIRRESGPLIYRTSPIGALLCGGGAVGALVAAVWLRGMLSETDYLALMTLSFVATLTTGAYLCFGSQWMASAVFPMSFLIFMIPMPDAMANTLEVLSMQASADVAALFLTITGTPLLRDGQVFALPGIVLHVAQECSGIRSSWVLFITSLLASHLLLKSPWRRAVLVAFVIPLGIVRNGFRILVIGLLCVHVGPHMIDSRIHHQGGPLFFVLSLGPLFLFLWWLRRREQ